MTRPPVRSRSTGSTWVPPPHAARHHAAASTTPPAAKVPAVFDRRCIPPDCVVRRLPMPNMRPPHAWSGTGVLGPAGALQPAGAPRRARCGAGFTTGCHAPICAPAAPCHARTFSARGRLPARRRPRRARCGEGFATAPGPENRRRAAPPPPCGAAAPNRPATRSRRSSRRTRAAALRRRRSEPTRPGLSTVPAGGVLPGTGPAVPLSAQPASGRGAVPRPGPRPVSVRGRPLTTARVSSTRAARPGSRSPSWRRRRRSRPATSP